MALLQSKGGQSGRDKGGVPGGDVFLTLELDESPPPSVRTSLPPALPLMGGWQAQ